ncbi:hypothetical protein F8M41_013664 [Gigaspora margarita]|uniref:Uncharacterized protein n=1 Tax=Gigaspora margarita TaxID=4874 RepID=A0A8H4AS10_GIGMA|nr:hypothetical protein F8M41_013664 [Gigaspora margarita]
MQQVMKEYGLKSELNLYCQEYTIENAFQELYNIHIEEEEKENINETKNQLNIDLDEYIDEYYLDDNK